MRTMQSCLLLYTFIFREIEVETLDLGARKKPSSDSDSKANGSSNNNSNNSSSADSVKIEETDVGTKRKLDEITSSTGNEEQVKPDELTDDVDDNGNTEEDEGERVDASTDGIRYADLPPEKQKLRDYQRMLNRPKANFGESESRKVARPIGVMKGHTAFLTFAMAPLK